MSLRDDIEKRAHELYEQSGRQEGHDWENWFEAERMVQERQGPQGPMVESAADNQKEENSTEEADVNL